ncbi:MAG: hypothetical protein ACYS32_15455 [Planctomycetota bacterium]|jgi:hypothetical protein
MHLRDIVIWSVCIVLAVAFLIAAGLQLDFINAKRQDMGLIVDKPENVPPSLAFATIATGAFRGLLVDALWIRADRLKEEGQFFDAKQLAEWITVLQPRFATVWEFQAWNMAYNISVAIPETRPDQRWQWVKNGYELLRDQGLEKNPKSILLYRELARIFQHKIGGNTDESHKYYKIQLALAMEPLVGSADNQYFQALAEAPVEWQEMIKDANMLPLISALKSADKEFDEDDKFVSNYLSLRQNPARFKPDAFEVINNFRGTTTLKKFDVFAKAHQLRSVWKLDPVFMQEMNQIYGPVADWEDPNAHLPLDWRHPDSHAIYWGVKGLQMAGTGGYSPAETNTDRIVFHSLQNLFRYGKIFIYDVPVQSNPEALEQAVSERQPVTRRQIFLRPDLRMFEPYNQAILAILEKYRKLKDSSYVSIQNSHRNMLKNAILSFYQAGSFPEDPHRRQAQKIYEQLGRLYPLEEFKVPLVIFARERLIEEIGSLGIDNATEIIQMLLREAYVRYALHDDNEAFGREKMAQEVHEHYMIKFADTPRIDLPEMPVLRYMALNDFMEDWRYPPNLKNNLLGRIKVERPDLYKKLQQEEGKLIKQSQQQQKGS